MTFSKRSVRKLRSPARRTPSPRRASCRGSSAALHLRAMAHDKLGQRELAERDMREATELEPLIPRRWVFRAQLAAAGERPAEARAHLEAAIEAVEAVNEPDSLPRIRWELGQLARAEGQTDEARRQFEAALEAAAAVGDSQAAAFAELILADLDAEAGDADAALARYARLRGMHADQDTSPSPVHAERRPSSEALLPEALPLAPPADDAPVLRIVAGDEARVEHWVAGRVPMAYVVPFDFAVHRRTAERLRWYVEEYAERPVEPASNIAADVEEELRRLGEALFQAVLGAPSAAMVVTALRDDLERTRIEIVADTAHADALPWELLRDPETGVDLALRARALSRTTPATGEQVAPPSAGALRVLLVIARPEGRLDVPFRSVADALLRELDGAAVDVDVLRPPTFAHLASALARARSEGLPYSVVHFDGHGTVLEDGRGALVFEDEDVDGSAVGAVLREAGVTALVLNACRSAPGEAEQVYGSVARRALEGVAGVVAMRFNVFVPSAAMFVGGLYRTLAGGATLDEAVGAARRLLADGTAVPRQPRVRDWCVPALYRSAAIRFSPAAPQAPRVEELGLRPVPRHGFVGRDEVFVELEAGLVGHPHVVLRGFHGAGKTTLAMEFARWFARTGGSASAGPYVSFARPPSTTELRACARSTLAIWDDVGALERRHHAMLAEIAAAGGRVLVLHDGGGVDGLPLIALPNLPAEEAYALGEAVARDEGVELSVEAADALGRGVDGHALAIVLAARELARRGRPTVADVEALIAELRSPEVDRAPSWAAPLYSSLDTQGAAEVAVFHGYVSVVDLGALRGDGDVDRAERDLEELMERGLLTRVAPGVYAVHPGLAAAVAASGRARPTAAEFVRAMDAAGSLWLQLGEQEGLRPPWEAEFENVLSARRTASDLGAWSSVNDLMNVVRAATTALGLPQVWRREVLSAAPAFIDPATDQPVPGMDEHAARFFAHLASVAELDGDADRAVRLRTEDVRERRRAAADALAVPAADRTDAERALVRRLAVGLTNLGLVERDASEGHAVETFREGARLAHELGDWRLEALNDLNVGVYLMTLVEPPAYDDADAAFAHGYGLVAATDAALAAKLLTERVTVAYERGLEEPDPRAARALFEAALDRLQLAADAGGTDEVICHQLGQVYRRLGEYGEARAWLERTIELSDRQPTPGAGADARLHLAETLEEAKLLAEALTFARSAEEVLGEMDEPDPALQLSIVRLITRLELVPRG